MVRPSFSHRSVLMKLFLLFPWWSNSIFAFRVCWNIGYAGMPIQACGHFKSAYCSSNSFGKQQNRNNRDREKKHNKQQLKGKSKYSVQTMAQVHMHINNSVANSGDGQTEVEYTFIWREIPGEGVGGLEKRMEYNSKCATCKRIFQANAFLLVVCGVFAPTWF